MSNIVYDSRSQSCPGDPYWLAEIIIVVVGASDQRIALIKISYNFGDNPSVVETCRGIYGVHGKPYQEFHIWDCKGGKWEADGPETKIMSTVLNQVATELQARFTIEETVNP